ncbi:MAG: response regulator [Candidatus Omnitrophota bacterium]
MNILIADDTREITTLLRVFLEKKGHTADVAENGKQALDMIRTNKYDLAFFDHNMPDMTGLELVKFIKQNNIKTKTVILSGYSGMGDSFAKIIGADAYLSKPCGLEDIEAIVKKYAPEESRDIKSKKKKILVVEDEANIAKLIKARLNANGYDVLTVNNGKECLASFDSFKPDLVFLDVMMPVMDGYSTIAAMKEQKLIGEDSNVKIPVVMLSAFADEKIKNFMQKQDIRGYITKPFKAEDLLVKIEEILGKKGDNSV